VLPLFVLEDSLQQIAGHADIQRVASASRDVRKIDPLVHAVNLAQTIDESKPPALQFLH
jgi:hypothetical protein